MTAAADLSEGRAEALRLAVGAVRRRIVPFVFVLYIFAYLDRINIGFAALQMNEALKLSPETYGFGAGIFFLSYVTCEVPSNLILARVGARLWIARIMITWGLVSAATMFVKSAPMFYALRFLLGLAEAGFFPGLIFYLTEWVPARDRARAIAGFMTAVLVAGLVGGPVSGALLELNGIAGLAGWQWLFLLEGVPSVLLGFAVLRILDDRPEDAAWLPPEQREALVAQLREEKASGAATHTAGGALLSGSVWLVGAAYFFSIPVALYGFGFWLPQIIRSSFNGTEFEIGLLSAIPYLAGVGAMIVVARHSDRTGERRWHVVTAATMCCIGFIATGFVHGLAASLFTLTIAMVGLASMFGPFWTLGTAFLRGTGAAAGIALVNSIGNVGGFVGPYLIGYLKSVTQSFAFGLMALGVFVAIGGVLVLMVPEQRSKAAAAVEEPLLGR